MNFGKYNNLGNSGLMTLFSKGLGILKDILFHAGMKRYVLWILVSCYPISANENVSSSVTR